MAVYKNKAGQKLAVFAVDSDGAPKAGDSANITAQISKDGAASAATNDTNPTELDGTNHPGIYLFDLTQAESDADLLVLSAHSATVGVTIRPVVVYTEPEQRVAASVTAAVTVGTNNDKTGYSLHADYDAAKTAAQAGAQMDLVDAPNATAVAAIQSGLSTLTAQQVWEYSTRTLSNFGTLVADIWGALLTGISTVGSIGKLVKDNLDAAVSSRSTYAGADTAGTTTLLDRLTAARAGYLDKLNVSGTLAHSDAADTYKADVSGLANDIKAAMEAEGSALDKIQAAVYDSITSNGVDTLTLSNGATQVVDADGNRTTTEP